MVLPPCFTSISAGALGRSASQMSWRVSWKCHRYLPVFASAATRVELKRLSPGRSPPYWSTDGAPNGIYTIPRFSSTVRNVQTFTPERFFQLSLPHVSLYFSLALGTELKVHTSFPVRMSHARTSPAGPSGG